MAAEGVDYCVFVVAMHPGFDCIMSLMSHVLAAPVLVFSMFFFLTELQS